MNAYEDRALGKPFISIGPPQFPTINQTVPKFPFLLYRLIRVSSIRHYHQSINPPTNSLKHITHHTSSSYPPPPPGISPEVIDGVPAQGARVLVAALEPLVEAGAVEEVLAGLAALVGHALVGADDAVADGALALALHGAHHVAAERHEAVDDAAAL